MRATCTGYISSAKNTLLICCAFIFLGGTLQSCVAIPSASTLGEPTIYHVTLAKPQGGQKGLLGHLHPLVIAVEVNDSRPAQEQEMVGDGKARQTDWFKERILPAKVVSEKDPVEVVSDAIKEILGTNGHTLVQPGDSTADVIIKADLQRFMSYPVELMDFGGIMESAIIMNIRVLTKRDNSQVLSKPFRTIYRKPFALYRVSAYEDVLSEGLARFVRSFSTDPEVFAALREVSQEA